MRVCKAEMSLQEDQVTSSLQPLKCCFFISPFIIQSEGSVPLLSITRLKIPVCGLRHEAGCAAPWECQPLLGNSTRGRDAASGPGVLGLCNFLTGEGEDGREGRMNICEARWR